MMLLPIPEYIHKSSFVARFHDKMNNENNEVHAHKFIYTNIRLPEFYEFIILINARNFYGLIFFPSDIIIDSLLFEQKI